MATTRRTAFAVGTITLATVALAGCAADPAPVAAPAKTTVEWGYEGAGDASHWGELDDAYGSCSTGLNQSPIDLPAQLPAPADQILLSAGEAEGEVVDVGHTFQFIADDEGTGIQYDNVDYEALQMHVHSPSEHTIDGVAAAAEFHFVHANANGDLLVVGVLAEEGAASSAWAPFVDAIEEGDDDDVTLDLPALLPASLDHYSYSGSLTTPPCAEGVQWIVLSTPIELSSSQIDELEEASHHNARPTQPLGSRVVIGGTGSLTAD